MTLEIVKTIKDRLTRAAKDGELPGRIILAGGTAVASKYVLSCHDSLKRDPLN